MSEQPNSTCATHNNALYLGIEMIDFRKEILGEAKRQGFSAYALAQAAGLPIRGVQSFLAGERDITCVRLAALMDVLGITLKRSDRQKGRS